jgi:hypothetical protein
VETAEKLIEVCKGVIKNHMGENQFLYNGINVVAEYSQPTKKGTRTLKLKGND